MASKNPVTYTAPHPVYVDMKLYETGEPFTTAQAKGKDWQRVGKDEKAAIEASKGTAGDPPLEGLSKTALEAVAVTKGVNPTGLDKDGLIAAIKAADEPKL